MINKRISFGLPLPWQNKTFETEQLGPINFLVGPNGSGKSKFAETLMLHLGAEYARLLGTDRLSGMEQMSALRGMFGDRLLDGLPKNQFTGYKNVGQAGFGIDAVILLEERLDLRVQVEATLSHLFNRQIIFDWDSGNLIARASLSNSGNHYRLDRDECHGIKELVVLLTHLYNDERSYLIIDEPELNLHPQYQAFFMQEVRKVAGDPTMNKTKKIIFLITHSPFILDFRSVEDVKSVISFSLDHSLPRQILNLDAAATARLASLVPRLNVHHKQLFFSDNPIFVEGVLDAQIVGAIQEARGVSISGAGSCIIDAGGLEEVNRYFDLCSAFGKNAHFLYDLDSLFSGNLRACVKDDDTVQGFLLKAGVGNDFGAYCGQLDGKLTEVIDKILSAPNVPQTLARLVEFLKKLDPRAKRDNKIWAKARMAVLTAIGRRKADVEAITSADDVANIEGRLKQIVAALKEKNIILLPGGTLERYLPKYSGDHYEIPKEAKRPAVEAELIEIANGMNEDGLSSRYGELYEAIRSLPSKLTVDVDQVLRNYLADYIHNLQVALINNPTWQLPQLQAHLSTAQRIAAKIFSVQDLTRNSHREFSAIISVTEILEKEPRVVRVTHETNAGMGNFQIEAAPIA